MKHKAMRSIAVLGLFFMLAIAGVQAQSGNRIEVTVPFDFTAGKETLKAGIYTLRRISDRNILIRSADGEVNAVVHAPLTIGAREYKTGERLVFNRYGDRYFLFQAWLKADNGRQLFPSDAEKAIARKQQLAKGAKVERVQVVGRHTP